MSTYIHFTDEQKQRAASVDLEEFLRCRGEKLLTSGREKRLARDHSVTIRGNEWYDHAEERGGHAVSFVQRFYHLSYPEAVTMLLGGELGTVYFPFWTDCEYPRPSQKDSPATVRKRYPAARGNTSSSERCFSLFSDPLLYNRIFANQKPEPILVFHSPTERLLAKKTC